MNSVTPVASVEAVNDVLKIATDSSIKAAEKIMKVSVEMALGAEYGKGAAVDLIA